MRVSTRDSTVIVCGKQISLVSVRVLKKITKSDKDELNLYFSSYFPGNVCLKPISVYSGWEGSKICRQIGIKHCWGMGLSKIQEKLPSSFITGPHLDVKCKIHKKNLAKITFYVVMDDSKSFSQRFRLPWLDK